MWEWIQILHYPEHTRPLFQHHTTTSYLRIIIQVIYILKILWAARKKHHTSSVSRLHVIVDWDVKLCLSKKKHGSSQSDDGVSCVQCTWNLENELIVKVLAFRAYLKSCEWIDVMYSIDDDEYNIIGGDVKFCRQKKSWFVTIPWNHHLSASIWNRVC